MRKDGLKHLDEFLNSTKSWDFKAKATFCNLLFNSSKEGNDLEIVLTTNLSDKFIKPTLLEMTIAEPKNFLPFKWYGQYFRDTAFLMKAYEIEPNDNSTKMLLLASLENDLWLSTHHLPDAYSGDFEKDENDIKLAFTILATLEKKEEKIVKIFTDFKNEIDTYKSDDEKNYRQHKY